MVNIPMIMHIVNKLPEQVEKVVLPVNYMKESLEKYFSENADSITPDVVLVEEQQPLGTGGAIKNCESEISDTFLVYNGDVLHSLNPSRIIESHSDHGGIGTLAVWEVEDPTRFGIIGFDDENRITRFLEKPKPEEVFSNHINAGNYVLDTDIFDHIDGGKKVSIEREVFPFILDHGLHAYPFDGYWVDAGTREAFLEASSRIMNFNGIWNQIDERCLIHPDAKILGPLVIGDNCRIGNSILGPNTVIGNNTTIDKDVRVFNSTLLNDVHVDRGAVIQNAIIGPHVRINEKEIIEDRIVVTD